MSEKQKKTSVHSKPLLYIHQPSTQKVQLKAQSVYYSGKNSSLPGDTDEVIIQIDDTVEDVYEEIQALMREVEQEKVAKVVQLGEIELDEIPSPNRKPFKEMTVEEKIHHVLNRPTYIPQPLCEILHGEDRVVGYMVKEQDGDLFLRIPTSIEMNVIPISSITELRMMLW